MNKCYFNDLPGYIKTRYPNFIYDINNKTLYIKKNNDTNIIIFNIIKMFDYNNDFYILSNLYLIIMWIDTKTYSIIQRIKYEK